MTMNTEPTKDEQSALDLTPEEIVMRRLLSPARAEWISDRDRQILKLVGSGLKQADVAARLGIVSQTDISNRIRRVSARTKVPRHRLIAYGALLALGAAKGAPTKCKNN